MQQKSGGLNTYRSLNCILPINFKDSKIIEMLTTFANIVGVRILLYYLHFVLN